MPQASLNEERHKSHRKSLCFFDLNSYFERVAYQNMYQTCFLESIVAKVEALEYCEFGGHVLMTSLKEKSYMGNKQ